MALIQMPLKYLDSGATEERFMCSGFGQRKEQQVQKQFRALCYKVSNKIKIIHAMASVNSHVHL